MRSLRNSSSLPWCVVGDLNNVVNQADKKGGRPYPRRLLEGFKQVLADCDLRDVDLIGYPFTWERNRGEANWIEVRLDRALVFDQDIGQDKRLGIAKVPLIELEAETLKEFELRLLPSLDTGK
uniref:Endonuclease/exonuclease/phosphatase domain-containing protein n=1 Tax=Cannabis sativa TaxID=3483 RepID=A0A803NW40_CANSA